MIENIISRAAAVAFGVDPDGDISEREFHDVLDGAAELRFVLDGNEQIQPRVVYPEAS